MGSVTFEESGPDYVGKNLTFAKSDGDEIEVRIQAVFASPERFHERVRFYTTVDKSTGQTGVWILVRLLP